MLLRHLHSRSSSLLCGIVILALALRLLFLLFYPGLGPDGLSHLFYVEFVAHEGRLPTNDELLLLNRDDLTYEARKQPPLYYLIAAGMYSVWPSKIAVRLLSVVFGTLTVLVSAKISSAFSLDERSRLLSTLFLAVLPVHLYMSTQINNDVLACLLFSFGLLTWIRLNHSPSFRAAILVGVVGGLLCWTKLSGFLFFAAFWLFPFLRVVRTHWRRPRVFFSVVGEDWKLEPTIVATLAASPLLGGLVLRYWIFYGHLAQAASSGGSLTIGYFGKLAMSTIGSMLGGSPCKFDSAGLVYAKIMVSTAVLGLLAIGLLTRWRSRAEEDHALFVVALAGYLWWNIRSPFAFAYANARLLAPIFPSLGIYFAFGDRFWLSSRLSVSSRITQYVAPILLLLMGMMTVAELL